MRIRRIKWRDSRMFVYQEPRDGDFSVALIESVGFVVEEDSTKIVLAGDLLEGDLRRVIVIPKENIEAFDHGQKAKRKVK